MRKHMRYSLRRIAEKKGVKASAFVNRAWNDIQTDKYGYTQRRVNQAKGTAPKHKWKNRIEAVVG